VQQDEAGISPRRAERDPLALEEHHRGARTAEEIRGGAADDAAADDDRVATRQR
jgi:hypothetical protein